MRFHRPRLSVVVPVYNVAGYLAECVQSILGQTYTDLEVVLVDDGSTDGSGAIAAGLARKHRRVRLVSTENRGPGGARNVGVAEARGELLAFADSDDTVPPHAYTLMVETLDRTGSDFVAGSARRLHGDRLTDLPWLRRMHQRRRLGVTAEDVPQLLGDVFAWNKLFRRSFWDEAALSFPGGVRYEDQVAMTQAYLRARRFDVLVRPVYHWRVRDDGTSITQRRHELADLEDRVVTKRSTAATVAAHGSPVVSEEFLTRVLPGDMRRYFANIPGCSDAYWRLLRASVLEFWGPGSSLADSRLPHAHRLTGWLVEQGRRTEAEVVMRFVSESGAAPLVLRDGRVIGALPFWDQPDSGIPPDLFLLRPDELGWQATVTAARLDGPVLHLAGAARLRRLGDCPGAEVRLVLTSGDGTVVSTDPEPAGSFAFRVDLEALDRAWPLAPRDAPHAWVAELLWETPGLRHRGAMTRWAVPDDGPELSTSLGAGARARVLPERTGLRVVLEGDDRPSLPAQRLAGSRPVGERAG